MNHCTAHGWCEDGLKEQQKDDGSGSETIDKGYEGVVSTSTGA